MKNNSRSKEELEKWISKVTHPGTRPAIQKKGTMILATFPQSLNNRKLPSQGKELLLIIDESTFDVIDPYIPEKNKPSECQTIAIIIYASIYPKEAGRVFTWIKQNYSCVTHQKSLKNCPGTSR